VLACGAAAIVNIGLILSQFLPLLLVQENSRELSEAAAAAAGSAAGSGSGSAVASGSAAGSGSGSGSGSVSSPDDFDPNTATSASSIEGFGVPPLLAYFILTWDHLLSLVISPWIGDASDRTWHEFLGGRRRPYVLFALPLACLFNVLVAIAGSVYELCVYSVAFSALMSVVRPVYSAYLGDLFAPEVRSRANGVNLFATGIGAGAALLSMGPLLESRGLLAVMLSISTSSLCLMAIPMLLIREPRSSLESLHIATGGGFANDEPAAHAAVGGSSGGALLSTESSSSSMMIASPATIAVGSASNSSSAPRAPRSPSVAIVVSESRTTTAATAATAAATAATAAATTLSSSSPSSSSPSSSSLAATQSVPLSGKPPVAAHSHSSSSAIKGTGPLPTGASSSSSSSSLSSAAASAASAASGANAATSVAAAPATSTPSTSTPASSASASPSASKASRPGVLRNFRLLWNGEGRSCCLVLAALLLVTAAGASVTVGLSNFAVSELGISPGYTLYFAALFAASYTLAAIPAGRVGSRACVCRECFFFLFFLFFFFFEFFFLNFFLLNYIYNRSGATGNRGARFQIVNLALLAIVAVAPTAYFAVHARWSLAVAMIILGSLGACVSANMQPLVYDEGEGSVDIGALTGMYYFVLSAGSISGKLLTGFIGEVFGNFRVIFLAAGLLIGVACVFMHLAQRAGAPHALVETEIELSPQSPQVQASAQV
jgi:MFS family permease